MSTNDLEWMDIENESDISNNTNNIEEIRKSDWDSIQYTENQDEYQSRIVLFIMYAKKEEQISKEQFFNHTIENTTLLIQ